MGILDSFFKPKIPILNQEDNEKLREIERQAYLKEAEELVRERGKLKAKQDFQIKQPQQKPW